MESEKKIEKKGVKEEMSRGRTSREMGLLDLI